VAVLLTVMGAWFGGGAGGFCCWLGSAGFAGRPLLVIRCGWRVVGLLSAVCGLGCRFPCRTGCG